MTPDLALSLLYQMLRVSINVAGPIILVALVVGVLVSILQVVTQIQEMSLTFVPKIIAIFFTLLLLGSWMMGQLITFASRLFASIPALIR